MTWETKPKMNQWDYVRLKSFYAVKETINKTKVNLLNGERYFQIVHLRKGKYSKYIEISYNSTTKQTTQLKDGQSI